MYYVLLNSNGIEVKETSEMPSYEQMADWVGIPGEQVHKHIDVVYGNYSDPAIVMIVDDESPVRDDYQPTCMSTGGDVLLGQVLIFHHDVVNQDFCLLSVEQLQIVKQETRLYCRVSR
ncbi:hypothetical protein [Microcoleus sp. B4-C1]|uniref:hypothetical protein n=1 Tax=Microcoleus sp. B4-C1 TaxID=2818660 RepID=UPI002FD33780